MSLHKSVLLALLIVLFGNYSLANDDSYTPQLTVEDFLAVENFSDAEISPNGRYVAMIFRQDDNHILAIKDIEQKGFPTIGIMGDTIIHPTAIKWANDERLLVQLRVPIGTERVRKRSKTWKKFNVFDYFAVFRTISVDINASHPVILMESERYYGFVSDFLEDDSEHVLMPRYRGSKRWLDKVNVYTGKSQRHIEGGSRTRRIFTDASGKPLYRIDYFWISDSLDVFEYTKDKKWNFVQKLTFSPEEEERAEVEDLLIFGLSKGSNLVYRRRNKGTGYYELQEINGKTGEIEVIASLPDQDIDSVITTARTKEVIGYTTLKDIRRAHYFDKSRQERYDAAVEQIGHNNISFHWPSKESTRAIIYTSGADNPGHFSFFDLESEKVTAIHDRYLKLTPGTLGTPAVTQIKMRDGLEIRSYILFPPNFERGKTSPMVLMPHGGPHSRDSSSYDHFAQFLATRGYIVVMPNFRGSSGYGANFLKAGYREWGGKMQDDLTDVTQFMIDRGYADENRLCIAGGSYGGYAALMATVKTPKLFGCAISLNGVANLPEIVKYDIDKVSKKKRKVARKTAYKEIGDLVKDKEMLDANSPELHADKIEAPILLIAGDNDRIVPHYHSQRMAKALRKYKKEFEYLELENASHNIFRYRDHREESYKAIEKFLAKHMK